MRKLNNKKYLDKQKQYTTNLDSIDEENLIARITSYDEEGMIFIAASGAEQIGMNLNIFGYKGKFIIIDVGISFTDLGSGIMLPATHILENIGVDNILAYVITHAHEDHIGGLARFLKKINKPVFSTQFTMCIIEGKLQEHNIKDAELVVVKTNKSFAIGDFEIEFTNTTHSIPDSNHIIVKTPNGCVFHTGDWKFDTHPVLGNAPDKNYLSIIGEKYKITALINDSTNAQEFKRIGTELEAQEGLRDHIQNPLYKNNRITVTCFSSNLARITSLQLIAKECGRTIVLIGRSLLKMVTVGIKLKLLNEDNIILDAKKAINLSPSKTLYVCTGSQGELNSVLQRCALDLHPILKLDENDILIFSSRVIPGNEKKISDIKNILLGKNIKIIDQNTATINNEVIHVSGHPGQQDIIDMIQLVKPMCVIPVHGDLSHLKAVEDLMKSIDYPCIIPKGNGTVFRIHNTDGVEIIGKLHTYTEVIDGNCTYAMHDEIFKQREVLNTNGVIVIIINRKKGHFFFNYGAVSKRSWEHLRNNLTKIIHETDAADIERLKDEISYYLYKKYDKNPILILYNV
jgi:ribonuclease J